VKSERSINPGELTIDDRADVRSAVIYYDALTSTLLPRRLMKKLVVTYDTVRRLALGLPGVEEGTSYGTPALKVNGKLFVRLHQDMDKIVLKMSFERREEMMAADPETYFITDHYRDYPWILVSLACVQADALPELLKIAHREASRGKNRRV
jgi:hypothetical protein